MEETKRKKHFRERKMRVDYKRGGKANRRRESGRGSAKAKTSEQIMHENEEGREEGRTAEQNRTEQSVAEHSRTGHSIK